MILNNQEIGQGPNGSAFSLDGRAYQLTSEDFEVVLPLASGLELVGYTHNETETLLGEDREPYFNAWQQDGKVLRLRFKRRVNCGSTS